MKAVVFTFILIATLSVTQIFGDEESVSDKVDGVINDARSLYEKEIDNFKKAVDNLKEKSESAFNGKTEDLEKKIKGVMSLVRERRSPQTFPDSQKSQADEALEKLSSAYDKLKSSVSGVVKNVTNSETYSDVTKQFESFKNTLSETGSKIKSTIHDYTAPSSEDKEEKH